MSRRSVITAGAATALAIALGAAAPALAGGEAAKAGYAPVNGGVGAIEMFADILPALAKTRQVIGVDLQGHGRTADIDRALSLATMADDVAGLMKHLAIGKADVMGYSHGGEVALRTAIQHPDLVQKLIVVSATFKREGWYPEIVVLLTKLGHLLRKDYDWSREVAAIKAPTLLVFGDADAVRTSHAVEFFELLGGGKKDGGWDGSGISTARLAILPGLTHYNVFSSPLLASAATAFLDAKRVR